MEVKGKSYLNKNLYKSIMINLSKDGVYSVNVTSNGEKLSDYLSSKDKFTNQIDLLSDEEQILEIVNHFLRNAKINKIDDDYYLRKKYIRVLGKYRNLFLQLKDNEISKKIISNIILKYNFDRANFVYDLLNSKDNIFVHIMDNERKISHEMSEYDTLYINLNNINNFDQEFLEEFISDELKNNNYMYSNICYFKRNRYDNNNKSSYENYEIDFNINNHKYCIRGFNACKIVNNILKKYNNKDFYNEDSYQLKLDI